MMEVRFGMAKNLSADRQSNLEEMTLRIKEEQLVLAKTWLQTGEVKIYRELLTEEKRFTVSAEYEELVIEKKIPASASSAHEDVPTDVIRIRLSEEQINLTKHRVALEDVSIYKQQIEEIKRIEETLKMEKSIIRISGSPPVIDESN